MTPEEFNREMADVPAEVSEPQTSEGSEVASDEPIEPADTSSEETETTATDEVSDTESEPAPKKTSRASERIRELIAERNRYKEAAERGLPQQPNQIDGVDEDGIDPRRFSQTVVKTAEQRAQEIVQFEMEKAQALQQYDWLRTSEVAQHQVSALIDRGFTPLQAAEIVDLERAQIAEEIAGKSKARKEASQTVRQTAQLPSAGRETVSDGYTDSDIERMDIRDYEKNRAEILKSMGVKGVR